MRRWVDTSRYLGFDRRVRKSFRLFEQRADDATQTPPSLHVLLRRLQTSAANLKISERAEIKAYSQRVRGVADLARSRGEHEVVICLEHLEESLSALPTHTPASDLGDMANQHLWKAMAALR